MAIVIACTSSLVTAIMLCYILFQDWDDFCESVKFYFTPEFISLIQGKYHDDLWAEARLILCLAISGLVGVGAYVKFS